MTLLGKKRFPSASRILFRVAGSDREERLIVDRLFGLLGSDPQPGARMKTPPSPQ